MKVLAAIFLISIVSQSVLAKSVASKCNKGKTKYSCSSVKEAKREFFCSSRKYSQKSVERVCLKAPKKVSKNKKSKNKITKKKV